VRSGAADDEPRNPANGRAGWFDVACCPPNVMRTISSLGSLLATSDDDGIQIHQYATSTITADLPAGRVDLAVATNYPWEGRIEITVRAAPDQDWTLALRIPAWCAGAQAHAGETRARQACQPGSYLRLRGRWATGGSVLLDLGPMPVRWTAAHERVDAARGCLAAERGPLVYCLEQADQPVPVDDVELVDGAGTAAWNPDLLGGMAVVQLTGRATRNRTPLYQAETPAEDRPGPVVPLTAIPYFAWANRGPGPMRVWIPRGV
jgi:DUF1680 family protein